MKPKANLDHYAVLLYIGPHGPKDKREYWITFGGHAHSQALSGLSVGSLGHLRHGRFE